MTLFHQRVTSLTGRDRSERRTQHTASGSVPLASVQGTLALALPGTTTLPHSPLPGPLPDALPEGRATRTAPRSGQPSLRATPAVPGQPSTGLPDAELPDAELLAEDDLLADSGPRPVLRRYSDAVPVSAPQRERLEKWARMYCQAAVDIVGGDRPVTQVLRWSSAQVFADLAERSATVARAAGPYRHQRPSPIRPKVLSVHSCFLAADVVEVSAHVRRGRRSHALATRFESRGGRWLCTVLQFAPA